MRRFCLLSITLLLAVFAGAETGKPEPSVSFEAEERLTAEALARYTAPGAPARYRDLIQQLKKSGDEIGAPAKGLRFPVKSWEDGRPRILVFAEEAWITPTMQSLRGRKVRVETYRKDGTVEALLTADEVLVDRETMLAVARGCVTGVFNGDTLSGRGALIDLDAQYVRLLYKASILTRRTGEVDFTSRGMF